VSDQGKNIEAVLHASDGEIVGKIRTQKIFYLLEQLGMGEGFEFSYHHYGPYSENLAMHIKANVLFGNTIKEKLVPTQYGNAYSIFSLAEGGQFTPQSIGTISFDDARDLIGKMKRVSSVVLELAATIHWLKCEEKISDWRPELKARKPQKATDVRIKQAEELLASINLA